MSVAHEQIRAFVERIEHLEEERVSIARDIAEVYAEAKGNGFDRKALKIVVTRRRQDHNERMELEAMVELYEAALMGFAPDDYEEVGTVVATRAPAHAHATGQIETPMSNASGQPGGVDPERQDDAASSGETANHSLQNLQTTGSDAAMRPQTGPDASAGQATVESPAPHSEAADLATVTVAEAALVPRVAAASEPIADISKPNPICRDPEDCGVYASWHLTCEKCKAAAAHRVAA